MARLVLMFSFVLTFLLGCSNSASNIKSDYVLAPNSKGIVFGTVSNEGGSDGWVYINKKGSKENIRLEAVGISGFAKEISSGMKKGSLFTLDLDPGVYEINSWTLYVFVAGFNSYYYLSPQNPKPIEFEVKANQATYLGSYNIKAHMGKNIFQLPVVSGAHGVIANEIMRDKSLFDAKYPQLKGLKLINLTPNPEVWHGQVVKKNY